MTTTTVTSLAPAVVPIKMDGADYQACVQMNDEGLYVFRVFQPIRDYAVRSIVFGEDEFTVVRTTDERHEAFKRHMIVTAYKN